MAFFTKDKLLTIVLAIILSVATNQSIEYFWHRSHQVPRFATVQIRNIVKDFAIRLANRKKLTPTQTQEYIKKFQQDLTKKINIIAKRNNVVLLPKRAVLSQLPDLTTIFMRSDVTDVLK